MWRNKSVLHPHEDMWSACQYTRTRTHAHLGSHITLKSIAKKVHTKYTKPGQTEIAINQLHSCFPPQNALDVTFPSTAFYKQSRRSHFTGDMLNVRSKVNMGNYMCIDSWGERREANNIASPSSRSIHYKVRLYSLRLQKTSFQSHKNSSFFTESSRPDNI